jgi:hypothetical protein
MNTLWVWESMVGWVKRGKVAKILNFPHPITHSYAN